MSRDVAGHSPALQPWDTQTHPLRALLAEHETWPFSFERWGLNQVGGLNCSGGVSPSGVKRRLITAGKSPLASNPLSESLSRIYLLVLQSGTFYPSDPFAGTRFPGDRPLPDRLPSWQSNMVANPPAKCKKIFETAQDGSSPFIN